MWLPDEAATPLTGACEALKQAVEATPLGAAKGEALAAAIASLRDKGVARIGVLALTSRIRMPSPDGLLAKA